MMTTATPVLLDQAARRTAIAAHERSLLVEAGAGSGKTAVMAGRIALLLARGIAPAHIAAVTFTELAASELLIRVREFVAALASGQVPAEMRAALPAGPDARQLEHLQAASHAIDEMTCSTIHGFCQRLIRPYPVEAGIDPGATLMDRDQADLVYRELADAWLRAALADAGAAGAADPHGGSLLAQLAWREPAATVALAGKVLDLLRQHRQAGVRAPEALAPRLAAFRAAVQDFQALLAECATVDEAETAAIVAGFAGMAQAIPARWEGHGNEHAAQQLAALVLTRPAAVLLTASGGFAAYKKKGKWSAAARAAGLRAADGEAMAQRATACYAACRDAWLVLQQHTASWVLAGLVEALRPVADQFRDYKRQAGLLDFDDLIHAARDLLRDHEPVRRALAGRFTHVLVDEFQDTDPLQSEIFWRLCGEPVAGGDGGEIGGDGGDGGDGGVDWRAYRIRPGALFLVGDPKQAIYRFRGADVAAYVEARMAFARQDGDSVLAIATNFRSRATILDWVNARFADLLSEAQGQPGFTALQPFHADAGERPCVAALDVAAADEDGAASAEQQRDAEAEAVAELCARLIGSEPVIDRRSGQARPCRPGDIALLAPTGSELWRYEEALERRGVPVATQAGKGLYRRQEIQDLIAVTRVLADPRDTLALGALLRGPLVGLSEEELLDIVWALPRTDEEIAAGKLAALTLHLEAQAIAHPLARHIVETLQALRRRANATTPHALIAQAVEALRVRPLLQQRHRGQAERALANVDLYLNLCRAYAVRGLRALAQAMTAAWSDEARAPEGRPDAQEEAVALYTMHAAKGLEWPVVVPINTMTQVKPADSTVVERHTGHLFCPVFGTDPVGLEAARQAEQDELQRERLRLWYVAATRARELLVLPRLDVPPPRSNAWIALPQFPLQALPALDLSHLPADPGAGGLGAAETASAQTPEVFAQQAATIAAGRRRLAWVAPSRDEGAGTPLLHPVDTERIASSLDDAPPAAASDCAQATAQATAQDERQEAKVQEARVQGGRERGLLIHKLLEEVLNGETADVPDTLAARAAELIGMLGLPPCADPARGPAAVEIAASVARTLALPEVAALRPALVPEYTLYAATAWDDQEEATAGIADAIAFGDDGRPQVVIDWKSDVDPAPQTVEHYRAQVRQYLAMSGARRGLIVMVTSGRVIEVDVAHA